MRKKCFGPKSKHMTLKARLVRNIRNLGVLVEESENNNPKWTVAAMEKYMRDQGDPSVTLGLVSPRSKNGTSMRPEEKSDNFLTTGIGGGVGGGHNGELAESAGEESSPSWGSSSTGNTPSYSSGGMAFEFGQKCVVSSDNFQSGGTPLITTSTAIYESNGGNKEKPASGRRASASSRLPFCGSISSDQLAVLDSEPESPTLDSDPNRKLRKGSADSGNDNLGSSATQETPSKGSKLTRLLRRTHSAGCSKDVPAHALFLREKTPVTKTKSADAAPCSREDGDEKQRRNRKTLAQDMKMRLSFLRRRHTDSNLQPSVRPSPEDAQKWAESFQELTNSKYGLSLFRAFLSREFSEENIEFWLACEEFKRSRSNKLSSKARKIYDDFVAIQSPKEVNLDSSTRSTIQNSLPNPDRHSFDSAQRRIQGMMEQDAYLRFLQSELYLDLIHSSPNSR